MKKFINDKLPYVLIILITIMIMQFIYSGSSDRTFVETFSFGSTITSIILSVVAILYTFIASYQSQESNTRIINSSAEINKNTHELSTMVQTIGETIESLNKIEELKDILIKVDKDNNEMMGVVKEMAIDKELKDVNLNNNEIDFKTIISNFTLGIKRDCLFICLGHEKCTPLDIEGFNKFYNQKMIKDDLPKTNLESSIMTTLNILSAFSILKYEYSSGKISIKFINEKFNTELKNYLPTPGGFADAPQARYYGSVYEFYGYKTTL